MDVSIYDDASFYMYIKKMVATNVQKTNRMPTEALEDKRPRNYC